MKNLIRSIVVVLPLMIGCKREHEGFDGGGPITRYLIGRWQLEKVVTPSSTRTGAQIGYSETFESGNDQVDDYDKIFRNESLVSTYTWIRSPAPVSNAKDLSMIVSYQGGAKRYFKVRQDPVKTTLEASGYVSQIGSTEDSVRYYYYKIQ